jgi:FK506-binding nuclear protein
MAAIDPSAPIDPKTANGATVARATLKLIRQPINPEDFENSSEEGSDEDDDEYMRALLAGPDSEDDEDESDEEAGPSDPAKSKKARKEAALKELLASIDNDSDEDMEDAPKKSKKGKAVANVDEDEEESEDDDEEEEDLEIEEFVICTLDAEKVRCKAHWQLFLLLIMLQNFQQPLDITIGEDERVFFKVSGTHAVHLTGNYLIPDDDGHNHHHEVYDSEGEDDDEDYDLSPSEDELELEDDDEEDELDTLDNPRVVELDNEEAPALVKAEKKGKNKRAAEESLDEIMEKSGKSTEAVEEKLSKKQQKKLKNNKGEAVAAEAAKEKESAKADKKVQFAKNLEQGPTGKDAPKPATNGKGALGVKVIKGVKIDDKKLGSGPAAKKGDRVGMRYIGKLVDGKVFDSNKKGKPFSFKLGAGEVIQGWDIGIAGMSVGGERRLTVPANLAYGSKSLPGIPANSTLVFDVKMLEIK